MEYFALDARIHFRLENTIRGQYSAAMTEKEWAETLITGVAVEVKRLRKIKKMSIRALSERTEQLGHHIGESVLSNFEYGRRGAKLDIVELLVLAAALQVPPARLLWPNYPDGMVDYLPQLKLTSDMAGKVFTGHLTYNPDPDAAVVISNEPDPLVALVETRESLTHIFREIVVTGMDRKDGAEWINEEANRISQRREELNARIAEAGGVVSSSEDSNDGEG